MLLKYFLSFKEVSSEILRWLKTTREISIPQADRDRVKRGFNFKHKGSAGHGRREGATVSLTVAVRKSALNTTEMLFIKTVTEEEDRQSERASTGTARPSPLIFEARHWKKKTIAFRSGTH